jgi:hypothetical protein
MKVMIQVETSDDEEEMFGTSSSISSLTSARNLLPLREEILVSKIIIKIVILSIYLIQISKPYLRLITHLRLTTWNINPKKFQNNMNSKLEKITMLELVKLKVNFKQIFNFSSISNFLLKKNEILARNDCSDARIDSEE